MSVEKLSRLEERVEAIDARLREVHKDVRELREGSHRQRGFIAGASAAFAALWATVAGLGALVWQQYFGSGGGQ